MYEKHGKIWDFLGYYRFSLQMNDNYLLASRRTNREEFREDPYYGGIQLFSITGSNQSLTMFVPDVSSVVYVGMTGDWSTQYDDDSVTSAMALSTTYVASGTNDRKVYVWKINDSGTWNSIDGKYTPPYKTFTRTDEPNSFGEGVTIYNDEYVVIGTQVSSNDKVYIYHIESGDLVQTLTGNSGTPEYYGQSVIAHNNTLVVACPADDNDPNEGPNGDTEGSLFVYTSTTKSNVQLLTNQLPRLHVDLGGNVGIGTTEPSYKLDVNGDARIRGNILGNTTFNDDVDIRGNIFLKDNVKIGVPHFHIERRLVSDDGVHHDCFGLSVAISGNYAIVGAPYDDDISNNNGSAYIFNVHNGTQVHKLVPSDGAKDDYFGSSVDIDGNYAIVGAYKDDDVGEDIDSNSGSAYIFNVDTGTRHKLVASDGVGGDYFGYSVAISGNYAIVGAPYDGGSDSGGAYIFNVSEGTEVRKLVASDGVGGDQFGYSVAISGNYAIVGARYDDDGGSISGSAYIFNVQTGTEVHKLVASDEAGGDAFGSSVAISDKYAIVSAPYDNPSHTGSVYIFNIHTGEQLDKIVTVSGYTSASVNSIFVAIDGDNAIVGQPYNDEDTTNRGNAYLIKNDITQMQITKDDDVFLATGGGKVGIGTTSPKCNINTNIYITNADNTIPTYTGDINGNKTTDLFLGKSSAKGENYWGMWMGTVYQYPYSSYIQAGSHNTHYPLLLQPKGGNVGIGTTSPEYLLELGSKGNGAAGNFPSSTQYNKLAFPSPLHDDARYLFANRDPNATTACLDIHYIAGSNTYTKHLMTFHNSGNVGIGTTNPTQQLQVGPILTFQSRKLDLTGKDETKFHRYDFFTGPAGIGPGVRVRLSKSIYPGFTLDVVAIPSWAGNVGSSSYWTVNNYIGGFEALVGKIFVGYSTNYMSIWLKGGVEYNCIIENGGVIVDMGLTIDTAETIQSGSNSDDRIKHNEVHVNNGLHIINQLKPQKYIKTQGMYEKDHDFNLDASGNPLDVSGNPLSIQNWKIETGFIAQDIEKIDELKYMVVPGTMTDMCGNQIKTIEYKDIFVYNVAATQELYTEQQVDKARIAELESQLENVLARLAKLEGQ